MKRVLIILSVIILIITLAGCAANKNSTDTEVVNTEVISTPDAPEAIGPYAQARTAGNFVFTSGQIGIDPATGELCDGLEAQCEQVFKNLSAVLDAAGSSLDKALKTTVFITDMNDFSAINEIYAKYFSEPYPARSCVEVASLPKGALIECEIIAVR